MAEHAYECTGCKSVTRIDHGRRQYPKLSCSCGAMSTAQADDHFREATQKAYDHASGKLRAGLSGRYRPIRKVIPADVQGVEDKGNIVHKGYM